MSSDHKKAWANVLWVTCLYPFSMTGRAHALLVLKSFLSCHIQLCIFSENQPGECTIKACLSLPAYPGHASGRMGAGYSGLSCQVDSSRQVEGRLRGLDQAFRNPNGHSKHNGFYCLEVVPQRHHPGQPLPSFISNNHLSGWHWKWAAFIIQALSCLPCQYWYCSSKLCPVV